MDRCSFPEYFSAQLSGMCSPNLETILATRPDGALGQSQQPHVADVERVNSPQDKAAILAHLTINLAMLSAEKEVRFGHA